MPAPVVFSSLSGVAGGAVVTSHGGMRIVHSGTGSSTPTATIGTGSATLTANGNVIYSVTFTGTSSSGGQFVFTHNLGLTPTTSAWTASTGIPPFFNTALSSSDNVITVTGLNVSVANKFRFAF